MDILTGRLGPREIAFAVAFGVLLGLLPKDNLLFVLLAVLFFLSHASILIGLVIALVVSFVAPWIHEGVSHSLGYSVLISPLGQATISTLHDIPALPWMRLDNTVVLGSFLLGTAIFFPVFFLVWIPMKIVWPKKKAEESESEVQASPSATRGRSSS